MNGFILEYNRLDLTNDISEFILKIQNNIKGNLYTKKYLYVSWYLTESLDLLLEYDGYDETMNLLSDEEYQTILNKIKQILNKEYYEHN